MKSQVHGGIQQLGLNNNGLDIDAVEAFSKSNRLPLKKIDDANLFEENLDDKIFAKIAVSF